MKRIENAGKILFNELSLVSNEYPHINIEINSFAVNGILNAMNLHTMQYLNPVRDLLKKLSGIKHVDLPMDEINKVQSMVSAFFMKNK